MQVGVIGLGKMGSQIVRRFEQAGHTTVVYDANSEAINALSVSGSNAAQTPKELIAKLGNKPIVWLMIPSQYTGEEITALCKLLPKGAIIIDGGNSDYRLTLQRAKECSSNGIELVDVGVSGGVHGLKAGFSMMIGGSNEAVKKIMPLVESLGQKNGYAHFGPTGAGHFIKMVHNGVEYGMMESLAEGYRLLNDGEFKGLDLSKIATVWQHGSVNRSWLNELCAEIFKQNPKLEGVDGVVSESGEAKWTVESAQAANIPVPVIAESLAVRRRSQSGETNFGTRLLALLRNAFGGHDINPK